MVPSSYDRRAGHPPGCPSGVTGTLRVVAAKPAGHQPLAGRSGRTRTVGDNAGRGSRNRQAAAGYPVAARYLSAEIDEIRRGSVTVVRIAHFTDASVVGVNGIASSIGLLTRTLRGRGHDCVVVSAGPLWGGTGGDVIWVPSVPTGMGSFRFVPFPLAGMRDRAKAWQPDVVHVHTPGPLGAAGISIARELGIPAVYTYHTDMHGYAGQYFIPAGVIRACTAVYGRHLGRGEPGRRAGRYEVVEAANARVFASAEVIIAPTEAALRRCRMEPYAEKIQIIATPAGLPPVTGPGGPAGAVFRGRYGIPAGSPVVLFVGRLTAEKGVGLLVDAFAQVLARVPAATLVLVGPESRTLRLGRLLDRAGLGAHTVRTGALTGAGVQEAYRAGTVFAFPSATDTQGIVLHEAALAGLPIVMTDPVLHAGHPLAGAAHLAGAGPDGLAAGLCALLLSPEEARDRGERGRLLASELTADRFADETLRAYHDAVGAAAGRI